MSYTFEDLDKKAETIKVPQVVLPSTSVPPGFMPVELSTNGKLGVPALIHVRNFQVGDLFDLSVLNDEILPDRVIAVLNSLIYEKGVDVAKWPDPAIIELMVRIYTNFFQPVLYQVAFPWDASDLEYLEAQGDEGKAKAESLRTRKWRPTIDLNLTAFRTTILGDEVKPYVRIRKSDAAGREILNAKFLAYPRYGDTVLIREVVKAQFGETDQKYDRIRQKYERIERLDAQGADTSNLGANEDEFLDWQLYEVRKSAWISKVTLALYLCEVGGQDIESLPLQEKVRFVEDAMFDINLAKKLDSEYAKLKFGIDSEVTLRNPITGGDCVRQFTFRIMDIVQAVQQGKADGYDVSFDD